VIAYTSIVAHFVAQQSLHEMRLKWTFYPPVWDGSIISPLNWMNSVQKW